MCCICNLTGTSHLLWQSGRPLTISAAVIGVAVCEYHGIVNNCMGITTDGGLSMGRVNQLPATHVPHTGEKLNFWPAIV